MNYVIEIPENKFCKVSEHVKRSLRELGKAMQIFDEFEEDDVGFRGGSMGNRMGRRMGHRGSYGNRFDEEEEYEMRGRYDRM